MRLSILLLLFAAPLFATDPPKPVSPAIVELSPVPATKTSDALPLDLGKYRWFGISGYDGKVTWKIQGTIGNATAPTSANILGAIQGSDAIAWSPVPAGSLVVWGTRPGTITLTAWGVVAGEAKELDARTLAVGGAPPNPGPMPVPPHPQPDPTPAIAAGPRYIVIVEPVPTAGNTPVSYLGDIAAQLKAKGHTLRTCNPDTVDQSGAIPKDLAPYIQRSSGKKLPRLFLVEDKQPQGRLLFEGDLPATSSDFLKLLSEKGG